MRINLSRYCSCPWLSCKFIRTPLLYPAPWMEDCGLMFCSLRPVSSRLGLSFAWSHCVVSLGKAHYSHNAISTQAYKWVNLVLEDRPALYSKFLRSCFVLTQILPLFQTQPRCLLPRLVDQFALPLPNSKKPLAPLVMQCIKAHLHQVLVAWVNNFISPGQPSQQQGWYP